MIPLPVRRPLTKVFRDWMESIRQYGPLAVAAYLFDFVRVHRAERAEGFDRRFETDTATVVYPWNLPSIGPEHTPEIHLYEATPAWLIREILESIPLQPNMFAFVDIGSGRGGRGSREAAKAAAGLNASRPIRRAYLVNPADFVNPDLIRRLPVADVARIASSTRNVTRGPE
jgi:hypothetical protein